MRTRVACRHVLAVFAVASLIACSERGTSSTGTDASKPPAEEPVVHFANFAAEIGPTTLADFERETGIKVVYDVYEANTTLDAKLLTGASGYDVVVPGNNFLENQVKAGVYLPLDRAQLPNWKNLDPTVLTRLERNDPGNRHGVPYLFGTTSIGYNVAAVRKALGSDPPDSWALVFDPSHASRLQKCGIMLVDSAWVLVNQALHYLGRDPNSERAEDLADAMATLRAIRPYVRNLSNGVEVSEYAEGNYCVFIAPSSDFRLARDQARAANTGVQLQYFIPREGGLMWIDTLAIPADAPHPGNAHRLINFLLRPDVITKVTEATYFANPNLAADALVPRVLRDDPLVYPDAKMMERLDVNAALSPQYMRKLNREYARFKTGE